MYFPLILVIILLCEVNYKKEYTLTEIRGLNNYILVNYKNHSITLDDSNIRRMMNCIDNFGAYFNFDEENLSVKIINKPYAPFFFDKYFVYNESNREYVIQNFYNLAKEYINKQNKEDLND